MNATLNEKLWERTKTAFIFAAIVIGLLYFSKIGNYVFLGLVGILSYIEYYKLRHSKMDQYVYNAFMMGIFILLSYPLIFRSEIIASKTIWALVILGLVYNLLSIIHLYKPLKWFNKKKYLLQHMEAYIAIPLIIAFIILKEQQPFDRFILKIILLIWVCDSAAYLVGSRIGKNKLFPRISPNKTIEGSLGAGVFTILVGILIGFNFDHRSLIFWIIVSIVVWIFGTYGDLVQSSLKRELGIKDTGSIMPGHGGFLDRFDSFIFVWPFIALVILIFDA